MICSLWYNYLDNPVRLAAANRTDQEQALVFWGLLVVFSYGYLVSHS